MCVCKVGNLRTENINKYSLYIKLLVIFRKSNFLGEYNLMRCLLFKEVQVSKTALINLNSIERMVLSF